jgi:uncharacterized protein YbjT (DUF2867 family)
MRVVVTGGTGMVGRGVLLECLAHPDVDAVLSLGRSPLGMTHPKLREVIRRDLFDLVEVERELAGFDACFFCLGASSVGMKEADYARVTHDLTLTVASTLRRLNPGLVFVYVSGAGTDSTEKGASMWARVKGKTENDLLGMGFKAAFMFRPGYIHPMKGVSSRTALYRAFIPLVRPLFPVLKALFPAQVTTTENVGLAMIHAVQRGYPKPTLDPRDINALAEPSPGTGPSGPP